MLVAVAPVSLRQPLRQLSMCLSRSCVSEQARQCPPRRTRACSTPGSRPSKAPAPAMSCTQGRPAMASCSTSFLGPTCGQLPCPCTFLLHVDSECARCYIYWLFQPDRSLSLESLECGVTLETALIYVHCQPQQVHHSDWGLELVAVRVQCITDCQVQEKLDPRKLCATRGHVCLQACCILCSSVGKAPIQPTWRCSRWSYTIKDLQREARDSREAFAPKSMAVEMQAGNR